MCPTELLHVRDHGRVGDRLDAAAEAVILGGYLTPFIADLITLVFFDVEPIEPVELVELRLERSIDALMDGRVDLQALFNQSEDRGRWRVSHFGATGKNLLRAGHALAYLHQGTEQLKENRRWPWERYREHGVADRLPLRAYADILADLKTNRPGVNRQLIRNKAATGVLQMSGVEHLVQCGVDRLVERSQQMTEADGIGAAIGIRQERDQRVVLDRLDLENFLAVEAFLLGQCAGFFVLFDVGTVAGLNTVFVIARNNADHFGRTLVDGDDVWFGVAVTVQIVAPVLLQKDMRSIIVTGLRLFGIGIVVASAWSVKLRQEHLSALKLLDLVRVKRQDFGVPRRVLETRRVIVPDQIFQRHQ